MGDCRLRILQSLDGKSPLFELSVSSWSSDNTIADCLRQIKSKHTDNTKQTLWHLLEGRVISLWDCTKYPAVNITKQTLQNGTQTTLHAAGWFPSGTLQLLPANATSHIHASADAHHDFQFNQEQDELQATGEVKLVGKTFDFVTSNSNSRPTASQVLQAVPGRFKDDDGDVDMADAILLRRQNKQKQREAEKERARKLDDRIRRLNDVQASKTSLQVRKMLIKSRATGRNSLREEDRVYLHVCFDEDERQEDYRFFSLQDTIGAALSSFQDPSKSTDRELLVSLDGSYYRVPSSLRFQQAIQRKAMEPGVSTVFVRFFSGGEANSTTSFDDRIDDPNPSIGDQQVTHESEETARNDAIPKASFSKTSIPPPPGMKELNDKLLRMFPLPKKQSATLMKVQQMKMKGKAKGDPKRVKAVNDRFFFELVVVTRQDNQWQLVSKGPVYYALSDRVDRCCSEIAELSAVSDWTVLVFRQDDGLRPIASSSQDSRSQSWQALCSNGGVTQFAIIVWLIA